MSTTTKKTAAPKLVKGQQPGKAEVVKYPSQEAALRAAVAADRLRTAVIQISPGVFTLGSRRAALKAGHIVMGRAGALAEVKAA